ncbi:hypothetical protein M3Y98_00918900 [Aphelenchoides besseyi]|nr:hypothetical protein M3Y98_00918900 [Aphelenchoides besseyi]
MDSRRSSTSSDQTSVDTACLKSLSENSEREIAGWDYGCYDYGYCGPPMFMGGGFGWYEPPMVVEETTVVHHNQPPPPPPQVVYVNGQPPQNRNVQYVMNDNGRLVTVSADRVNGPNADFVVANAEDANKAPRSAVQSAPTTPQTYTQPYYSPQQMAAQYPQPYQQPQNYPPPVYTNKEKKKERKRSCCNCCVGPSSQPIFIIRLQ